MQQLALDIALQPQPTLEGFVAGPNALALACVRALVHARGENAGTVYLWGEAGCGKTHLLRAVQRALEQGGVPCGWLDAQSPCSEHVPTPFDARWRVVLLDDVERYSSAQQHTAFAWFIDAMTPPDGAPARAVVAAGALPATDLPLREDLRSRLGWGQAFALRALSDDEMLQALQAAAHARGLPLSQTLAQYMLRHFARDMGSLNALLARLDRHALQARRPLSIALLKHMLDIPQTNHV